MHLSNTVESFDALPDNPSPEEWDKWSDENLKVDATREEKLVRYPKTNGNCGSCRWWTSRNIDKDLGVLEDGRVFIHGELSGECLRFPPSIGGGVIAEFPTTTSDMSCGEWELRYSDTDGYTDLARPDSVVDRSLVAIGKRAYRTLRDGVLMN